MSAGAVPFRSSEKMSFWLARVRSMPACAAATPIPGTTIAWISRRSLAGYVSMRSCDTQVAEAITTVRVCRSTATMDQVADTEDAETATSPSAQRKRNRI